MPPAEGQETEAVDAVFAEQLARAMARTNLNQRALAEAVGRSQSAVSRWLAGKRPGIVTVKRIAAALSVSVDELLGVPPQKEPRRSVPPERGSEDWHSIPKVAITAAGSPIHQEIRKDETVWYAFHRSWVMRRAGKNAADDEERLIVVQVDRKHLGESMVPTVRPGAVLVVDRGPRGQGIGDPKELRPGSLYLVDLPGTDGGLTVKRVFYTDGVLTLVSDNQDRRAYPPRVISMKNRPLQRVVVGRVIWVGHEED